jgi:hypothetical protein
MRHDYAPIKPGPGPYVGAVALAIIVLCATACGRTTLARAGTPTASPETSTSMRTTATSLPTAAPQLAFHSVALPAGYVQQNFALSVSPLDGRVAWACSPAGDGAFHVWLTTDEATSWQAAGTLHPTTPEQASACSMSADQGDTQAAVFTVSWGGGEGGDLGSLSYYTADDGAHWTQLPGWTAATTVDTIGATVVAMLTITTPLAGQKQPASLAGGAPSKLCAPCSTPTSQQRYEFAVSHDGLHSWRELQPEGPTASDQIQHFWGASSGGEIYATTDNGLLLHSTDGGAAWSVSPFLAAQVQLARHPSGSGWTFCGLGGDSLVYRCSTDTGATWHVIPLLQTVINCAECPSKGGDPMQVIACSPSAILDGGSLIAFCQPNHGEFEPVASLAYQLMPGASAWDALGGVPSAGCVIAPNRIIWCTDEHGDTWMTATLPA